MSENNIDLNSPEVKEAIKAAVEEATGPLLAKRDELLSEVKALKKGRSIDPAEVERLESELDAAKQQLTAAQKEANKAKKEAEEATKKAQEIDQSYAKTLADAALTEALAKAGVSNPVHLKAAKALLSGSIQVAEENGTRLVKAGDKALSDFITEWAGGEEGKYFTQPTGSNGGGSQSGGAKQPESKADIGGTKEERVAAIQARLKAAQE